MKTIFEPGLTLAREKDGEYTLHALTIAPSGAYYAGRARPEAPPGIVVAPEVQPVVLEIHAHAGGVAVLIPLRHALRNLDLVGKTSVLAFVVQDGRVLGSADIAVTDEVPGAGPISTSDWYAWADKMPPEPPGLHVIGNVQLPSPGWTASLRPAVPQGINPRQLLLDLDVRPPRGGIWPQVVTTVSVRHDEASYDDRYDGVLVRIAELPDVALEIEEVS